MHCVCTVLMWLYCVCCMDTCLDTSSEGRLNVSDASLVCSPAREQDVGQGDLLCTQTHTHTNLSLHVWVAYYRSAAHHTFNTFKPTTNYLPPIHHLNKGTKEISLCGCLHHGWKSNIFFRWMLINLTVIFGSHIVFHSKQQLHRQMVDDGGRRNIQIFKKDWEKKAGVWNCLNSIVVFNGF